MLRVHDRRVSAVKEVIVQMLSCASSVVVLMGVTNYEWLVSLADLGCVSGSGFPRGSVGFWVQLTTGQQLQLGALGGAEGPWPQLQSASEARVCNVHALHLARPAGADGPRGADSTYCDCDCDLCCCARLAHLAGIA